MALEAMQRNGHNLGLGVFECEGLYDTPKLVPVHFDEKTDWISFNCAGTDRKRSVHGVHFFVDDYIVSCGQMDVHGILLRIAIRVEVASGTSTLTEIENVVCQCMRSDFQIILIDHHQNVHNGLTAHAGDGGSAHMAHIACNILFQQHGNDPFLGDSKPLRPFLLIRDDSDLIVK